MSDTFKKPEAKAESGRPEDEAAVTTLLLSMADTAWRMFTPSIILVPAGIWLDLHIGTKPWLTLFSAALGLACGVLLVKRQLREP